MSVPRVNAVFVGIGIPAAEEWIVWVGIQTAQWEGRRRRGLPATSCCCTEVHMNPDLG